MRSACLKLTDGRDAGDALPALSVRHKLFDWLTHARNKHSLAHENERLDASVAQFVVDCVLSWLAFIERIEAANALPLHPADGDIPPDRSARKSS